MFEKRFISATKEYNTLEKNICAPYFRKNFIMSKPYRSAKLTVAVCGLYEVYVNGTHITKGFLAPYRSNPDHYVFTDEYDLSKWLRAGNNVVAFILGNGLQNSQAETWDFVKLSWRSAPKLHFSLDIRYEDDSAEMIAADTDVKVAPSPIYFDDYHYGEFYDARREIDGWNGPEFDDTAWDQAIVADNPKGELCACEAEPITARGERQAVSIVPFEDGYVFDFGENEAGLCRLTVNGECGQLIEMRFFETLVDGKPYYNNIRFHEQQLFQVDKYICSGKGTEVYMPRFTYHGFRYVYVEGITERQATKELLTYVLMSSDIRQIGEFVCDHEMINRIQKATLVSDLSNFYYFPTDCPHREKNGWTGDASLSAEQMLLNFAPEKSFKVWLKNIYRAMTPEGKLPGIIPTDSWGYQWGNGPGWDGAIINLPYYTYKYRGDLSVFDGLAEPLTKYISYLYSKLNDRDLIVFGLGDWCQTNTAAENEYTTPTVVTDSILSADIAGKAAFVFDILDLPVQKEHAIALMDRLVTAIRHNLLDVQSARALCNTQTAQAMAIYYGIFTAEEKKKAVENLVAMIHQNDDFMDVGILGGRVIFHVLAENGYAELAHKMITRPEFPSYGNWFQRGATTLWEGFWPEDGRILSKNHHFWGDVSAWFYIQLAGIKFNPTGHDMKCVNIEPCFIADVNHVRATHSAPYGEISVEWKRMQEMIEIEIDFPAGAYGKLILKTGYADADGKTVLDLSGGKTRMLLKQCL